MARGRVLAGGPRCLHMSRQDSAFTFRQILMVSWAAGAGRPVGPACWLHPSLRKVNERVMADGVPPLPLASPVAQSDGIAPMNAFHLLPAACSWSAMSVPVIGPQLDGVQLLLVPLAS